MVGTFVVSEKQEKGRIGTGNREQGTGHREQGTGNREQGTGNREQGTGNREQGTDQAVSTLPRHGRGRTKCRRGLNFKLGRCGMKKTMTVGKGRFQSSIAIERKKGLAFASPLLGGVTDFGAYCGRTDTSSR